ncbi:hypothetical protein ATO13_19700 [Stappia sp. 22II-S9-Z10]|nr:hypothetical protein ATO13_19700 [Stappia sp. 22II-S9-Z10]
MMRDRAIELISRGVGAMHRASGERWALVIPASTHGSLGDAAMTIVARDHLREAGHKVCLLADDTWPALSGFDAYVPADDYLFHGGRRTFLELMWRTRGIGSVALVGADILDGIYNPNSVLRRLKIVAALARRGCAATVLGSSFNAAPNPVCVAALAALPPEVTIKARDPVSRERMASRLGRPIDLVADLAFLCPVEPGTDSPAHRFIAAERAEGRRIVALTANFSLAHKVEGFEAAHVPLAKAIIAAGHSIVMVPHDTRRNDSDEAVLRRVAEALEPEERSRIHVIAPDFPGRVKAVLAACDISVTSRMHAAILAMGTGVPAYCFDYQGKFEGLFTLLGLTGEDLLHAPEALVADPEGTARRVLAKFAERDRLSAHIAARLPEIRALSRANFRTGTTPSSTAVPPAAVAA